MFDFFLFCRRGLPMALFTLIALGATGIGPAYAGWIEMNPKLEWKWVEWVHMMQVSCQLLKRTEKLTDISGWAEYILCCSHSSWKKRVRRFFWPGSQRNSEKQPEINGIVLKWKRKALAPWFSSHVLGQFVSWSFSNRLIDSIYWTVSGLMCTELVVASFSVSSLADFLWFILTFTHPDLARI